MSVAVGVAARVVGLFAGPLAGVDLEVPGGRMTAVVGGVGTGKSTLVRCFGGLVRPRRGSVYIGREQVQRLGDAALTRVRRDRIGYVFGTDSLLPLTVAQNIRIGHELAGRRPDRRWFDTVVELLELTSLLKLRPDRLTTLERQRVACARALLTKPDVVLADEPTAELTRVEAAELLGFLRMWVRKLDQSLLLVTGQPWVAAHADKVHVLRDGVITDVVERPTVELVAGALGAG
jgi:putative ABC transport system ATP-binding protein